jgi:hypothetical protein
MRFDVRFIPRLRDGKKIYFFLGCTRIYLDVSLIKLTLVENVDFNSYQKSLFIAILESDVR